MEWIRAAAGARHSALTNPFDGAPTSAGGVDLRALVHQKDELVERMRSTKYAHVAAAYAFEVVPGHARFLDRDTLAVDGKPLRAQAYVVPPWPRRRCPSWRVWTAWTG